MEANTNTVPEDITQIQHQTASWQVCWWAQTRLRVETQLLSYDILNFCPTKSSHILSGLENLPFPPQGTKAERQKSERQRTQQLRESEIWATAPRSLLQQDVFTVRTVPMDLPYLFEHKVAIHSHTALLSCNPNFCQALPQTSSLYPVCQQVWVHTINLERASGRGNGGGEFVGGGRGGKVGQRTQTEAKAAAPSPPRSSSRFVHSALALSVWCGGDSWWGTFESTADWLSFYCISQVLYAKMFLRIGTELLSTLFGWVTWTPKFEMVWTGHGLLF